jgi:hypothetical protein
MTNRNKTTKSVQTLDRKFIDLLQRLDAARNGRQVRGADAGIIRTFARG